MVSVNQLVIRPNRCLKKMEGIYLLRVDAVLVLRYKQKLSYVVVRYRIAFMGAAIYLCTVYIVVTAHKLIATA